MSTTKLKSKKNKTSKKPVQKADDGLSICPVNGAGWCPYPFSAAQLRKRLKRKQEEAQLASV
ncbi:MAG: hypothetical protein K2W82_04405 [Candidatus Obscuribacterales bacterium]|nr:hypothetical protein [Candidatus Obscuribacterales bacterium]